MSARCEHIAVVVLLTAHAVMLAWAGWRNSPTVGEVPQLPSGIIHWRERRFDIYRVNPPLVRMVAAIPFVLAREEFASSDYLRDYGDRPEFVAGEAFAATIGQRCFSIYCAARWMCVPFSMLGAFVCWRWARDLYGRAAGMCSLVLWCFSPDILAHGQMITPDCAGAATGIAAGYVFWQWLKNPKWQRVPLLGGILGLSELTRTCWLILFALWPLIWILSITTERMRSSTPYVNQTSQLLGAFLIAVFIMNIGYGFQGTCRPLGQFPFHSRLLTRVEPTSGVHNRFAGTMLADLRVPLPADYVLGVDLQQKDFESYPWPSYLQGQISHRGWWYFYLYGLQMKTPLGMWLLLLMGLAAVPPSSDKQYWKTVLPLALPPLAIFVVASLQTSFSIHYRYVLPVLPYLYVWISRALPRAFQKGRTATAATLMALVWIVSSSLMVFPHSLSYFNELAGGPTRGHFHMVYSAFDWGQDLMALKRWLNEHPQAAPVRLAYYGSIDPSSAGIISTPPPECVRGSDDIPIADRLIPGWYAVSATLLRGIPWHSSLNGYVYFQQVEPTATAGYSINIYHLTKEDIQQLEDEEQRSNQR